MIYRGAMSRAPGPQSTWRDSYVSGEGALTGGCNRPMIYIFSQYVTAQMVKDPKRKAALMQEYNTNMDELVRYQGKTAGGWPIFGEGNAFNDKGLHFDLGYTMDHVLIMAYAHRVTQDERWAEIIRKFDTVVKTLVASDGLHFEGGFSERKAGKLGGKHKVKGYPDMVNQEAVRVGAPYTAQWAFNCSEDLWTGFPQDTWAYCQSAKGYGRGAFLTWGDYDLQQSPAPKSPGVTFPRQWNIYSVAWVDKNSGKTVRKASATIQPGGTSTTEFKWEVGEYPIATGLPLAIDPQGGNVSIEILEFEGNPGTLGALVKPTIDVAGLPEAPIFKDNTFAFEILEATRVRFAAGDVTCSFIAVPAGDAPVTVKCTLLRKP